MKVNGKDQPGNSEASAYVSTDQISDAMNSVLKVIFAKISNFIQSLPDSVGAEITEGGIYLTGGGAALSGMAERIESETGITTICVKDPLHAVILGASKMLDVGVATNLWKQTAVTRIN
jgi:rod shape-determining protein MreB